MAREWNVECKRCGKPFGYSDRSYRNSLSFGFSRPEYCEECQNAHKREKRTMGAPYFILNTVTEEVIGSSRVYHPEREHTVTEKPPGFDETTYGLTEQKIFEIVEWFSNPNHRAVVVVGATGSGKSTALPYWLANPPEGLSEDHFLKNGQILVTQPRIVAARGISQYVGEDLMGATVGKGFDIGYSYSGEKATDWRNVLVYRTDGQLVNECLSGKVANYGIIILDEAHERSENIDTILRLLKERMALYPYLRLIIASATINADFFRDYFQAEGACVIELEGKERLSKETGQPISYQTFFASQDRPLPYENLKLLSKAIVRAAIEKTKRLVEAVIKGEKPWGDILVFLHGTTPIDTAVDQLRSWANQDDVLAEKVEVYPLYRALPESDKDKVLKHAGSDQRIRVVVSTNIAEASVTVDGVVYEVETGVEFQPWYVPEFNQTEVRLVLISKANAKQRWGRTGRTRNGEVYCLYTQEQFETLFPDFPTAAIKRSSMESLVLTSKVAGLSDVGDGWLENPPQQEVTRAHEALLDSGAVSETGNLTKYGNLIRYFGYSPDLIEALMIAEDWGCAVEVATLLPVIRNGGKRRLLRWRYNWDAYTKLEAFRRHQALMSACRDDLEFVLKLFKAWDELPWLAEKEADFPKDELPALRHQWTQIHFVNQQALKEAWDERNQLLDLLGISLKRESGSQIDLTRIGDVRRLLVFMFPNGVYPVRSENYRWQNKVEPEPGTEITCNVSFQEESPLSLNSQSGRDWLAVAGRYPKPSAKLRDWEAVNKQLFSRLFVDQVFPVGFHYLAQVEEVKEGQARISICRLEDKKPTLEEGYIIDEELEVEVEEEHMDEEVEKAEETPLAAVNLSDLRIDRKKLEFSQVVNLPAGSILQPGDEIVVEVTGYEYLPSPVVKAELVPEPPPFSLFVKQHRYSDDVRVRVISRIQYEGDRRSTLVVEDVQTGLQVLLGPEDIGFSRTSHVIDTIPIGTELTLQIEHIDTKKGRVRLSNWETVETRINDIFAESEGDDQNAILPMYVTETTENGLFLCLSASDPEKGFGIVVRSYPEKLPGPIEEYEVGKEVLVGVYRKNRKVHFVNLPALPKKALSQVDTEDAPDRLTWRRKVLRYTGRMTFERLYELKTIADDVRFHKALEELYWRSNLVYVGQFVDSRWYKMMQEKFPIGSTATGCVEEINRHGAIVQIEDGLKAWMPASKMGSAAKILTRGSQVEVRILELRPDQQEPVVELVDAADPIERLKVGSDHQGTVVNFHGYGMFVELQPGVVGRVDRMGIYLGKGIMPEEVFSEGESVWVRIKSIDVEKRQIEFDMKIPQNDPIQKLTVGATYTGTVVDVKTLVPLSNSSLAAMACFTARKLCSMGREFPICVLV